MSQAAFISVRRQLRPVLALALPLILAELGWMSMGIVDTMMIGHTDHPVLAMASSSLGQVLYNTVAFGLSGILLGLDTYLSQSQGAGNVEQANRWLLDGLALAAVLAVVLVGVIGAAPMMLLRLPIQRDVLLGSIQFLHALSWGTPALFLYFVLRRYLQAFNHVVPIALALVTANVINAAGNWVLIYGHTWGALRVPALGVYGSGLATSISRLYLAAFMVVALLRASRRHGYRLLQTKLSLRRQQLRQLVALGLPSGAQIFVEIAIFATVTFLIGVLGALPLAGHEIALTCASFTFMVPFAISSAASVRVGQAIGRGSAAEAGAAGWAGIALGAGAMATLAVLLSSFPLAIAGGFTRDASVIAATVPLLYVAAAFQFFDGLQITATGALRGAGNTHSGLIVLMVGYWVIGVPVGWYLGFRMHMGATGLWLGLCSGLVVAGLSLTAVWHRTVQRLQA